MLLGNQPCVDGSARGADFPAQDVGEVAHELELDPPPDAGAPGHDNGGVLEPDRALPDLAGEHPEREIGRLE